VHGHSSHRAKGIEVYRDKLILHGCGDFLNDYEGISGQQGFRGDLGLMYFPRLDPSSGRLLDLAMTPTRIRDLRVNLASSEEAAWLEATLNRDGVPFGTGVMRDVQNRLALRWDRTDAA
jgi:poly-gamma-glutamate synthesis protein (capsule biosynthesis protein)